MTTLAFFQKGAPKISIKTMMQTTMKPMPTCSGAPAARWSTSPFWHIWGRPFQRGSLERSFSMQKTPPPQYLMPAPVRLAPMQVMATPHTIGGKTLPISRGGRRAKPISKRAATHAVPRNSPYAATAPPGSPTPDMVASRAMGRKAKDGPSTLTRPVPM